MNESEYLPEELRCFICLKLVKNYKVILLNIQCKDSTVLAGVPVCMSDFEWTRGNEIAASALCQSRLERLVKKSNESHND